MSDALRVITTEGIKLVAGLSPATRSLVAKHHNAVRTYLQTGDTHALDEFRGVRVDGHELETRARALDWWGQTDELSYESIYEEQS